MRTYHTDKEAAGIDVNSRESSKLVKSVRHAKAKQNKERNAEQYPFAVAWVRGRPEIQTKKSVFAYYEQVVQPYKVELRAHECIYQQFHEKGESEQHAQGHKPFLPFKA